MARAGYSRGGAAPSALAVPSTSDAVLAAMLEPYMGFDGFYLDVHKFTDPAPWFEVYVDTPSAGSIYLSPSSSGGGGLLEQGSGGGGTGKAFLRIKGTGPSVVVPVGAAAIVNGPYPCIDNMQASPWAFGALYNLGNPPSNNAQHKIVAGLTDSGTDPKNSGVCLDYHDNSLKLRLSNVDEFDTGIVTSGWHSTVAVFDGAAIRIFDNGVLIGQPFSALQGLPAAAGWLFWGQDENGVAANGIAYWSSVMVGSNRPY